MSAPATEAESSKIQAIDLTNPRGDRVSIMSLGGILQSWEVATGSDGPINIVLGYHHPHSYLKDTAYHGAIAGRYCNRIARSRFSIGETSYTLVANEGTHHLHGGPNGFNQRIWNIEEQGRQQLKLSLCSEDGYQGYPGNLQVSVSYKLEDDGALAVDWEATTDADTVVSLTSHSYFNLAGCGDILEHYLRIPAGEYTPVDGDLIPTGEICSVAGSALDLRKFSRLEDVLASANPEIQACGGLDHNWAGGSAGEMLLRAELFSPHTGLLLSVNSTLPGLQCYTGNHLQGNSIHDCHEGVCLEPQYYPDSPNHPNFPSPLLRAGETMRHQISYTVRKVHADLFLSCLDPNTVRSANL